MKYIRTKDGRIRDTKYCSVIPCISYDSERGIREEDSCFTFNWFNQEGDLVLPTTERISLKHDVIKQADTIEELCDEFVVADKLGNKPIIDKILTANNVRLNVELLEDKNVYGAIWTEWGLKYVSKMNEKGELELI